jgi:hypothetical protein
MLSIISITLLILHSAEMTHSTTGSIMTFIIKTLTTKLTTIILKHNTQYKWHSITQLFVMSVMLSVVYNGYVQCHYAVCHLAECCGVFINVLN